MSGDGRPLSVRLHEKAGHLEAFAPATAQDFHELADEVAALEAAPTCACGGREPVGRSSAQVYVGFPVPGDREAQAHLVGDCVRLFPTTSLEAGQWVDVLIFARLPAKEEAAP